MRKTTISTDSPSGIVKVSANIIDSTGRGARSTVLTVTVPKGVDYNLYNRANIAGVDRKGFPIVLDLNDVNGVRISGSSMLTFGYQGPSDEFEKFLRAVPYSTWRGLSTTDQRSQDFRASLTDALDLGVGSGLKLREGYRFLVLVESAQLIDVPKSYISFEVEEVN